MSKKIFKQKFQDLLDEELNPNSSKVSSSEDSDSFAVNSEKPRSKKQKLFSKYDPKSEYETLKEKIRKKDSETLAQIKFRKAQARKNEKTGFDSDSSDFSNGFKNSNLIIDDEDEDSSNNQNQELNDFFENKKEGGETKNKKTGVLISVVILIIALLFFSFSFIRLYAAANDNVRRGHQRCLRDIEKLSEEQVQELDLRCEKPNVFNVMLNPDLANQNYRENREMIEALGGGLEEVSQRLEAEILEKIEILETAGVEGYPGLAQVQGLELTEKVSAQEELLAELSLAVTTAENENLQDFKTFENLILNIDSIENLTTFETFYEENQELSKSDLLLKRITIQENLENLKGRIETEKDEEFLTQIQTFLALDEERILTILTQANFANLEEYEINALDGAEVNQKLLAIVEQENYPNLGVINSENLSNNQSQPLSGTASQAWAEFFTQVQALKFNPVLLAGYISPEDQNQAFVARFSELSVAENEAEFSNLEIQEGMADEVLLQTMQETLPAGFSPFSTGYAVRIRSSSLVFYDWFRQDNFYNLKRLGFIPLRVYDLEPETGNGELEMVFIPGLREIFQINLSSQSGEVETVEGDEDGEEDDESSESLEGEVENESD